VEEKFSNKGSTRSVTSGRWI